MIAFGVLVFSCLMTLSSGQGYIRLSRSDPMMSLLFPSKNIPKDAFTNVNGNNEQAPFMMKRDGKNGRRNFLNFIFRKYPDRDSDAGDARNKRIPSPIVELRPGFAETETDIRNKRSTPHPIVDQRPLFVETYLHPYFDYIEE